MVRLLREVPIPAALRATRMCVLRGRVVVLRSPLCLGAGTVSITGMVTCQLRVSRVAQVRVHTGTCCRSGSSTPTANMRLVVVLVFGWLPVLVGVLVVVQVQVQVQVCWCAGVLSTTAVRCPPPLSVTPGARCVWR
jgi:hypothetical protein